MTTDPGGSGRTDAELIAASRHDPEAFGELYTRHVGTVLSWLTRVTGDREAAADLAAETFTEAVRSRRACKPTPEGSALPWLFGIAHNTLRHFRRTNRVRDRARRKLGIAPDRVVDDLDVVDERIAAEQAREELRAALASLPERQRRAVLLRFGQDLPFADVAGRLDCSPVNARVLVSRAVGFLHAALTQEKMP